MCARHPPPPRRTVVAITAEHKGVQALENAQPKAGERVLIHAGAGGVGCWLVQLAKKHYKCHVAATAGPKNQTFLREVCWISCTGDEVTCLFSRHPKSVASSKLLLVQAKGPFYMHPMAVSVAASAGC